MGKKNLHEAFQEAADRHRASLAREAEQRAGAEARQRPPEPAAPLPDRRPRAEPAAPAPAPATEGSATEGSAPEAALSARRVDAFREPLVLVALLLAFALGIAFGSRPVRPVTHAPDVSTLQGVGESAPPPAAADAPLLSAETASQGPTQAQVALALADPDNRYTIQVATYGRDDRGLAWAKDLVSWMEQNELPAAPPQAVGEHYVVLVGVGRTQAELEELLTYVQEMPNAAQSPGDFADAFILRIDQLIGR